MLCTYDTLLIDGGSARIWPLEVGGGGKDQNQIARKDALINSIRDIHATDKYVITLYEAASRPGIILHKLAPSVKKLQRKKD